MNRKVTVVGGAGNVGATVARAIAQKELADVVVIDIADSKAAGVALDIYESCPIEGSAACRVLLGVVAILAATVPAMAPGAGGAAELNALVWCDHADPELLGPFEQANYATVNVKEY